MYSTLIGI